MKKQNKNEQKGEIKQSILNSIKNLLIITIYHLTNRIERALFVIVSYSKKPCL